MRYGSGAGDRIARIAEQVGGAAINGVATNYFGVRAAAEAMLKAAGTTVTAQAVATAESKVLAVDEPGVVSTVLPAIAGALWLGSEAVDHFTGGGFGFGAHVGEGVGIPAARDFTEHVTAVVRRKLRNVAVTPPPTFAGAVRGRGAPRAALIVPPQTPQTPQPVARPATPQRQGAAERALPAPATVRMQY